MSAVVLYAYFWTAVLPIQLTSLHFLFWFSTHLTQSVAFPIVFVCSLLILRNFVLFHVRVFIPSPFKMRMFPTRVQQYRKTQRIVQVNVSVQCRFVSNLCQYMCWILVFNFVVTFSILDVYIIMTVSGRRNRGNTSTKVEAGTSGGTVVTRRCFKLTRRRKSSGKKEPNELQLCTYLIMLPNCKFLG